MEICARILHPVAVGVSVVDLMKYFSKCFFQFLPKSFQVSSVVRQYIELEKVLIRWSTMRLLMKRNSLVIV